MKYLLVLYLIALPVVLNAQIKDTIYKKRLKTGEVHAVVYIDKDKNSPYYKRLETRDVIDKHLKDYTDSLKVKYKVEFARNIKVKGLPQKWISLEKYKGNYYTYFPCDFCSSNYFIKFSGNMMYWFSSENDVSLIIVAEQVNPKTYQIDTKSVSSPSRLSKISVINREKGIAVFEFYNTYLHEKFYKLMVDATKKARQ